MLCNSNQTLTSIYDITVHTHTQTYYYYTNKERENWNAERERIKRQQSLFKKLAEISERKTMSRFWGRGVWKNFRFIPKSYIVRSSKWWWYFIPITLCRLNFFFPLRWNLARGLFARRDEWKIMMGNDCVMITMMIEADAVMKINRKLNRRKSNSEKVCTSVMRWERKIIK